MDIEESTSELGDETLSSLINLSSEILLAEKEAEIEEFPSRLDMNLRTRLDAGVVEDEFRLLLARFLQCEHELRVYHQWLTPWIVEEIDRLEVLLEWPPFYVKSKESWRVTNSLIYFFGNPTSTRPQVIPLKGPITATCRRPTSLPQRK